jgi:hypothetical protein
VKITIVETTKAAPDGIAVLELAAGSEHDLPDPIAESLVAQGVAKPAGAAAKAKRAAPENKADGDGSDGPDRA